MLRGKLGEQLKSLCGQCQRRSETNPLRVFDCKVPSCQPIVDKLPNIADSLCEECTKHYSDFLSYLEIQQIPYEKDPRLVRGLDYYVRTTFEIVSDRLGPTQNALLGGGRYDGLSEALGGPPTKGFGFALGMERFVLLLSGRSKIQGEYAPPQPEVFLAYLDEAAFKECLKLASELRQSGIIPYLDFKGRSLKAQLRLANRLESVFSCTVGSNEIDSGVFPLKRMSDGKRTLLQRNDLAAFVKSEKGADAD
jgi:histidyl-tRNA synthetase